MSLIGIEEAFSTFASKVSRWAGSSFIFFSALGSIVFWAALGPYFNFSTGWQVVLTTAPTLATFLMVFIIQNSQNREGLALQIKLNEVIRALDAAENTIINLEELSQEELENHRKNFATIANDARAVGPNMPESYVRVEHKMPKNKRSGRRISKTETK